MKDFRMIVPDDVCDGNCGRRSEPALNRLRLAMNYWMQSAFRTRCTAVGYLSRMITEYYVKLRGGKESPTTCFSGVPAGVSFREFNAFINHLA